MAATPIKYVYELPYREERDICRILDLNDQWKDLGGTLMNFSVLDLNEMSRVEKCGESPSRRLLQIWGQRNNTVKKLYYLLFRMEHYQAMAILEPCVPEEYHILESDTATSRALRKLELESPNPTQSHHSNSNRHSDPTSRPETGQRAPTVNYNLDQAHGFATQKQGPSRSSNKIPDSLFKPAASLRTPTARTSENGRKIINKASPNEACGNACMASSNSCVENNCVGCSRKRVTKPQGFTTEYRQKVFEIYPDMAPKQPNRAARPVLKSASDQRQQTVPSTDTPFNANNRSARSDVSILSDCSVPMISYHELELATESFHSKYLIGKGGFGSVYKGTWKLSKVAIKKINMNPETVLGSRTLEVTQILDELKILHSIRHNNILQVFGFSADVGKPPCLVCELMENGSLDDRLQCKKRVVEDEGSRTEPLSWDIRLKIARGTALGLQYLHTVKDKAIIHGDVKCANILLDKDLEPKLGDFGLAREGPQSHYTSVKVERVNGTEAYIPQEYLRDRKLSTKVDTYGFGIVLFEICTGQRAYEPQRRPKFMKDYVEEIENVQAVIDIKGGLNGRQVSGPLFDLGITCTNVVHKRRPEMTNVYKTLEELTKQQTKRTYQPYGNAGSSPLELHRDYFPEPLAALEPLEQQDTPNQRSSKFLPLITGIGKSSCLD